MEMSDDFETNWVVVRAALPRAAAQHWVAADAMVDAHRDIRARVVELEAANAEWQEKHRSERRLREEQRDIVEAAEKRVAELEALAERRRQERLDALSVTTREGLSASEWVLRTGKAEQRVAELEREAQYLRERTAALINERGNVEFKLAVTERKLEASEQRAATLQAEVERLTVRATRAEAALRKSDEAHESLVARCEAVESQLRTALTESERKRAELVVQLEDVTRGTGDADTPNHWAQGVVGPAK